MSVTNLKGEDAVIAAIEEGKILWAFNLAGKEAKSRLVRVLAASVSDFIEGKEPPQMSEAAEWSHVVRLIFPTPAPSIAAKEIALAWSISATHTLNLVDDGLLRLAKGSPRRTGPGGSPLVDLQGAVEFLKKRRVM